MSDLYSMAMVAGMATCSTPIEGLRETDDYALGYSSAKMFDVLWNKILHKAEQRRVEQLTGDDPFYFTSTGFRQFGPMIYNDEGDSAYAIHEYNPSEDGSWQDWIQMTTDQKKVMNEKQVRSHLRYIFGDGIPCTCGICNSGGDCCGQWFTQGIDVWSAGDGRWYVKVHSYRNI